MKRAIAVLLAMLMVMPIALAEVTYSRGCGYRVCQDENPFGVKGMTTFDANSDNINEVVICTTPDKDRLDIIVNAKSNNLFGRALLVAQEWFGRITSSDLPSRHYGCVTKKI